MAAQAELVEMQDAEMADGQAERGDRGLAGRAEDRQRGTRRRRICRPGLRQRLTQQIEPLFRVS